MYGRTNNFGRAAWLPIKSIETTGRESSHLKVQSVNPAFGSVADLGISMVNDPPANPLDAQNIFDWIIIGAYSA